MTGELYKAKKSVIGPGTDLKRLIDKKILNIQPSQLRILDVGCGDPSSFLLFYHLSGFQEYKGIDTMSMRDFSLNMTFEAQRPEESVIACSTPFFERYELFYKWVISQHQVIKEKLKEAEFKKIFQIELETSCVDYLSSKESEEYKPNFLVLSNILHFLPNKDEAFDIFIKFLAYLDVSDYVLIELFTSKIEACSWRYFYPPKELDRMTSLLNVIHKENKAGRTLLVGKKKTSS